MVLHVKKSVQLLQELKRARWLPQFNDKIIKEAVEEIRSDAQEMVALTRDNQDLEELSREVTAGLVFYGDLIDRNKRCLLAYLNARLEVLERLRWEVGLMVPEEKLQKLHEAEKQYLNNYNGLLDKYMKNYVPDCKLPLDLTADIEAPQDVNVEIRVEADDPALGGIVTTDSGVVRLRQGYQLMVKRSDVEHLIRAGKVVHVKTHRGDIVAGGF
eukprot:TRINITY_DN23106_c0_g1_i1.p1 TRINITY_DN23106_c0_g1~~TRINITY_DN23106_c0_g1_i1.p1  ORF type:complete len:214 (-),score=51.17 TRINITY_DN23106_c0_g1_i1:476-1117(-)